jgi:hypothetical protein
MSFGAAPPAAATKHRGAYKAAGRSARLMRVAESTSGQYPLEAAGECHG